MRAVLKQGECRKVLGAAQWLPRPASDLSRTYELSINEPDNRPVNPCKREERTSDMSVIEREQAPVEVQAPRELTGRDVLLQAAYGYEEGIYDWCQGSLGGGKTLCLVGVLYDIAVKADGWTPNDVYHRLRPAFEAVGFRYKPDTQGSSWDLPDWNDEPGRTKEEVIARLREAAERA